MHFFSRAHFLVPLIVSSLAQTGCVSEECSCSGVVVVVVTSDMGLALENLQVSGGSAVNGGFRCSENTCTANTEREGTYQITIRADGHEVGTASVTQMRLETDDCCSGTVRGALVEVTLRAVAMPGCTTDADCPSRAACVSSVCSAGGACVDTPDHAMCAATELCDLDLGCVDDGGSGAHTPCTSDAECAPAQQCDALSDGRCNDVCSASVPCSGLQECRANPGSSTDGQCVGDRCVLVDGTGCDAGRTCGVAEVTGLMGETLSPTVCRPIGSTELHAPCATALDCPANAGCVDGPAGPTCAAYCFGSADCGPVPCAAFSPGTSEHGIGVCSYDCDPFTSLRCPSPGGSRFDCKLSLVPALGGAGPDEWISSCTSSGTGGPGDACTDSAECMRGHACEPIAGVCRAVCLLGMMCGSGTCEGFSPATTRSGAPLGLCPV